MSDIDPRRLAPLFFTGTSPFLVANPEFAQAMVHAAHGCALHASENIHDANGLLLWASGKPIDDRLLERLMDRRLRKPIELCVHATDSQATGFVAGALAQEREDSAALRAIVPEDRWRQVESVVAHIVPNPTELMLFSVLRHGREDRMRHAALVCALTLAFAHELDVHPDLLGPLARAALLHDIGRLYLPGGLAGPSVREEREHPLIGARAAVELARCPSPVSRIVSTSHERLDGWGYPRGLPAPELSTAEQSLLFAEAIASPLEAGRNGLRRAAIAARLVPGEFPPELVTLVSRAAQSIPIEGGFEAVTRPISLELRQVHSVLATLGPLLSEQGPETEGTRELARRWGAKVESLRKVLYSTGVGEELAAGRRVEASTLVEAIELGVLADELRSRIRELRQRIEIARDEDPSVGTSGLVLQLLDALRASEPDPRQFTADAGEPPGLLRWSRIFRVGVGVVDEQHRTIIDLINRLDTLAHASREGESAHVREDILLELLSYVGEHFATEERLMAEHDIPGRGDHINEHSLFRDQVGYLFARQREGKATLEELNLFLRSWLVSHILQTDKAMGEALNARGAR